MRYQKLSALALMAVLSLGITSKGCTIPGETVIEAAQLPITLHVLWDAPDSTWDSAILPTQYTLTVDGQPPVVIPVVGNCDATVCKTAFTVGTLGTHTLMLVAQNYMFVPTDGSAPDPNALQSSAPATITFVLKQPPGNPTNTKLTIK